MSKARVGRLGRLVAHAAERLRMSTARTWVLYGTDPLPAEVGQTDMIIRVQYMHTEPEDEGGAQLSPESGAAITPPQGPTRPRPTGRTREAPIFAPFGSAAEDDTVDEAKLAAEWYEEHVGQLDDEPEWW